MEVGEVRVAEDNDFEVLKIYLNRNDGWQLEYKRGQTLVWTRHVPETSDFKMIRLNTVFPDVPAAVLYDVLHDPVYRSKWDHYMLEIKEIGHLNPNNSINYYALSCPAPLKNRDFVIESSWLETGNEYMIINHSVYHNKCPPKKGFVRGTSFLTGFVVKSLAQQPGGNGCWLGYVTHSNPKGKLPSWVINRLASGYAPRLIKRLHKACLEYPEWKSKHSPGMKYWINPEQIANTPKIQLADCRPPSNPSSPDESLVEEIENGIDHFEESDDSE